LDRRATVWWRRRRINIAISATPKITKGMAMIAAAQAHS
jgi:hypothetical protein